MRRQSPLTKSTAHVRYATVSEVGGAELCPAAVANQAREERWRACGGVRQSSTLAAMADRSTARILVIEDEADIAALIAYQLAHAGYQVRTASNGPEAVRALQADSPDLVVLDLMLPDVSGLELLRSLRAQAETRDTPVIIVTARGDERDRLSGFEAGADDYIAKPFSPKELVLRVTAVLRRAAADAVTTRHRVLRAGPLEVDVDSNQVTVADREVQLTPKEYGLLLCLMERRGRTQSRSALLETVWKTTADIETRTVDMHLGRLRAKLGEAAELIETVRGFGYRFRPDQ